MLNDIITDELINPGQFVQVNKFQEKLAELRTMLNSDSDSLYSPLVGVLVELATEENFADKDILQNILKNINNLKTSLNDFRAKRQAELDSNMKNMKAETSNLAKIKGAYENMRNQSISKRIDATHYINFYTHEIGHFNAEKGRKNEEKQLVDKICSAQKGYYNQDKQSLADFKNKLVPYLLEQIQKLR